MAEADRTTPQTVRKKIRRAKKPAPRKAPAKKAYKLPQTFKTEAAADKPRKQKAGPPSPQITGRPTRKQPKRAPIRDRVSGKDLARGQAYVQSLYAKDPNRNRIYNPKTDKYGPPPKGTTVPPDVAHRVTYKQSKQRDYAAETARVAPALKVLEQTTRPLHAIAGAAKANVQDIKKHGFHPLGTPEGRSAARHAALRGIENKDKTTFSDVLKEAGVKNKTVRGVAGFAADVALDPTTYVTGGTASVARKTAVSAAKGAEKKALKTGLTAEQASRFGERAATQATKKAGDARGVTLRMAGHEAPGVTRATAAVGKKVKQATDKTRPTRKIKEKARHVAADVNPNVAPVGVSKAEHQTATRAIRTARAKTNQGVHRAQQQAIGIRQKVGEKNYSQVIDALEAGDLSKLSPELRDAAIRVRSQFRYANRLRKQAGIKGGERKNYVPHHLTDEAIDAEGKIRKGVGGKTIRPASSKARKEQRPLKDLRDQEPGRYSEDLPKLFANRMAEGHSSVAKAELNRRLADMGRDVRRGGSLKLGENEAVFHVKGSDLREVTDDREVARLLDEGKVGKAPRTGSKAKAVSSKGGRYVVLNKDIVKRATEGVTPTLKGKGVVHSLDRAQAGFKTVATATPGFHIRNIIGDIQNAYLGQSGARIPRNLVHAARILKAVGRDDKGLRNLSKSSQGKGTFQTPKYGDVTYDEAAKRLLEHGGARTGYTARDIPELARSGKKGIGKPRLPAVVKRAALNREDLPRLTTAVEALRRGATWEEAASRVAQLHFDYQHLTDFERQFARRAAPFYTFSARNIPLQAKSLVTKPGKFANYQKIREEATKASGVQEQADQARDLYAQLAKAGVKLPAGWEKSLSEWEQRNAGIPISWKGRKYTVSFALPISDLNEFPGAAGGKQASEWYQKMMSLATPIGKDPIEYFENHSFFFRDQIEREYSPNVAAPSYVSKFPDGLKKKLGVVQITDKRTGKKVWGWPGKMDYLAKAVPGSPAFVQQLMTGGADRQGRSTTERVLGFAGAKVVPVDPFKTAVNLAYGRMDEIKKKQAGLRQQGINAKNPTSEYTKLSEQLRALLAVTYQARSKQGYKVLPTQGGPKKIRSRSSSSSGGATDVFGRSRSGSSSGSGGTDIFGRSK